MLSFCRRMGFNLLDSLRGGSVQRACRELKKWDQTDACSEALARYREARIRELMEHADKTTAHYAGIAGKCFADIPVINKKMIKAQQDAFLSSAYDTESLVKMYTSGSTGTPFVAYQDRNKKKKVNAECIYYSQKVGYRVGDPLIYLRAVVKQVTKSGLKQFMQNQPLVACRDLSDAGIEAILQKVKDVPGRRKTLLAYASTYDAIRGYLIRGDCSPNPNLGVTGLISGSEMLYDQTRQEMERYFGCRCVSRYSNEENGILAQDTDVNNLFMVNEAHYYIEIMKMDKDEPAPEGEIGRVVVTDFFNYAMPMIRYDTGDVGSMEIVSYNGVKHRAISNFGGRKCDMIFDAQGNLLSPYTVVNLMWPFNEVRQFQFVQMDQKEYKILISRDGSFTKEQEMLQAFQELLGAQARISPEYVEEIPTLRSGKRKYIVNKLLEG